MLWGKDAFIFKYLSHFQKPPILEECKSAITDAGVVRKLRAWEPDSLDGKLGPAAHQLHDLGLVPEPLSTLVSSWVKPESF